MKKYDLYKNSGVEWLGEIPEHWEVKKVFHYFKAEKGKNAALLTKDYCGKIEGKFPVYSGQTENNGIMSSINQFEFDFEDDGCLFTTTVGAKAMTVSYLKSKFSLSQNCMIIVKLKKEIYSKFYYYHFQPIFHFFRSQIPDHMQASFRMDDLYKLKFYLPPIEEQTAIANFLDDKTTKIDQAIAIKQKQIELLKERRQILIHKAVTRGLDDIVKLKDSGVEWIGKIPEHWEVKKLRYLANCFPSNIDKHSKISENEVRLCNYTDVYKNDFITDDMDLMIATASDDQIKKFTLRKGDIVITKDSETASDIAVPTYIKEDLTNVVCGYHLAMIKTYQNSYSKYLFRTLQTKLFNSQFEVCSNGITRVGLGSSDLKNGYFLVPSEQEQIDIAEFIEISTTKIDSVISLKKQEIEKLKEYKMSLIDGVVTGKVKVC